MWTSYKRLVNNINTNTIICVIHKSHYEALNIPKTATYKEIKDAYYRLSMIYHPDKNKGSKEAANIFRDITSAYEVLGNVRQRRLYDNSANLVQRNSHHTFRQPFETMNTKTDLNKTNVQSRDYNFTKSSKAHYSKIYQRQFAARESISYKKINEELFMQQKTYMVLVTMIFSSLFIMILMFEYIKELLFAKQMYKSSEQLDKKD